MTAEAWWQDVEAEAEAEAEEDLVDLRSVALFPGGDIGFNLTGLRLGGLLGAR